MEPNDSGDRVRSGVLLVVLVLVAASIWCAYRSSPDAPRTAEPQSSVLTTPDTLDTTADVVPAPPAPAKEVQRVHRLRPPAPPAEGADAEALWSYGESYLGWQPRAEIDLAQHGAAELRSWIQQDLRLLHLDDGLDGLGYGY